MKKHILTLATVLGLVMSSQAVYLNGSISLSGGVVAPVNFLTATALNFHPDAQVTSATMDFAGVTQNVSGSATINPLPLSPFMPVIPMWTTAAGMNIAFDLTSAPTIIKTASTLTVIGSGVFTVPGYQPTLGSWIFTANKAIDGSGNETASWSVSQGAFNRPVPDGGMTAMLLGSALGLLGFARRLF